MRSEKWKINDRPETIDPDELDVDMSTDAYVPFVSEGVLPPYPVEF